MLQKELTGALNEAQSRIHCKFFTKGLIDSRNSQKIHSVTKSPSKPIKFPTDPSLSPADLVINWLEINEKSQKQFASETGLSESLVSMLLNKKRRFSPGILSMVAAHTGSRESDWTKHLQTHEEWSRQADSVGLKGVNQAFRAGILSNVDIQRAMDRGWIAIDPFDSSNLKESSIDLTFGECKRLSVPPWLNGKEAVNSGELSLRQSRHLQVNPGETWLAWAGEIVSLAPNLCGRIGSKSDLVLAGVSLNFGTQINPGWSGVPFVTLFNPTVDVFELDPGQPFMTLEIHALSSAAILSNDDFAGSQP